MSRVPCGCDLDAAARTNPDPRGRSVQLDDAARAQARWRCRFAGGDGIARDPDCLAAIRGVEEATGAEPGEIRGCPCAEVRTPDTAEAVDAYRWWKAGQLHLRVGAPSGALVEAIDLIANSVSQREADELRRLRERDTPKPRTT
jgi:hypothetical protein